MKSEKKLQNLKLNQKLITLKLMIMINMGLLIVFLNLEMNGKN